MPILKLLLEQKYDHSDMASWSTRAGTEAEAGGINPSNTKQYQFAGVKNYCFTWLNCQNFCHISSETFR